MKVNVVEVEVGVTKNMGNYESLRLSYRYGIQLAEGESVQAVRQQAVSHLSEVLEKEIKEIKINA